MLSYHSFSWLKRIKFKKADIKNFSWKKQHWKCCLTHNKRRPGHSRSKKGLSYTFSKTPSILDLAFKKRLIFARKFLRSFQESQKVKDNSSQKAFSKFVSFQHSLSWFKKNCQLLQCMMKTRHWKTKRC